MNKNSVLEKIRRKKIYYIDFDSSYNLMSLFDTKFYQDVFSFNSAVGIAIEPMTEAQILQQRRGGEVQIDTKNFQENSVCLLFHTDTEIDILITGLNACKNKLHEKSEQKKQEEYTKKFCGKVIRMKDILEKVGIIQ